MKSASGHKGSMIDDVPPQDDVVPAEVVELPPLAPRPWGFWATAGWSLLILAAFVAIQTVVVIVYAAALSVGSRLKPRDIEALGANGQLLSLNTWFAIVPCLFLIVVAVKLRSGWSVQGYLAVNPVRVRSVALWSALTAATLVVYETVGSLVGLESESDFMVKVYKSSPSVLLLWTALGVAAPLFEELFFRGFMFRGIQQSPLGTAGAIVLTALVWTLIHVQYDWSVLTLILLLGFLLGAARAKTNSTLLTVFLHSLWNTAALAETAWSLRGQ